MATARKTNGSAEPYDAIVIGAGVCGVYALYRLRELGFRATVLEAGEGPGGTWYWNRYPGCRFDSESWSYGYSFSEEILAEWNWSEHFAGQPETLSYVNYVVDRFDLRRDMQFGCVVTAAAFDEASDTWSVTLEDGRVLSSRFLLAAIGMLSAPTMPKIEGRETFRGRAFHTYDWPDEPVDVAGKRVGVIGTGATGVQLVPVLAEREAEVFVFQRRPNWCAPLHNAPISKEEMEDIRGRYDEIFETCRRTPGGFIHAPDRRKFDEVPEEERLAFWERLYNSPGFGVWVGNFAEALTDERVNAEYTKFIADKIRRRVKDPAVAEKLIPKDHGFGTRRVPLETNYYEAYNRPNVHLVDLNETPIERITETGLRTSARAYDLDIIVYATGFDAITGAYDRIAFTGVGGQSLREKWRDGPVTYLGVQVSGFPNLFALAGPQSASVTTNFPRGIEDIVDWVTRLLARARERNARRIEATPQAEENWQQQVKESYGMTLFSTTKSWFTGYNSNIAGRDRLRYLIYNGGAPRYRKRLAQAAEEGYRGFEIR